MTKTSQYKIVL